MAIRLQLDNDFDNSGLSAVAGDLNHALLDRQDYETTYPALRTFPCVYAVVFGLNGFLIDVVAEQIFLVRSGNLRLVAGQYGVSGLRDGAGSQAILGIGGFQEAYSAVGNTLGELIWTDTKTGRIRKITEQLDGTWNVSTVAVYSTTALTIDGSNNLWTTSGSNLIRIAPNGTQTTFPTGFSNINKIAALTNGHILIITRNNAWDILYNFNPATGTSVRVAGMNDAEVAAYKALHGLPDPVDGAADIAAAPPVAAYHSPEFAYYNSDGSIIEMSGGDERQLRQYSSATGQVKSLFPDGAFYTTQIRIGADTGGDVTKPFFLVSPFGKQPNGYPWDFRNGGVTAVQKVIAVDIGDPGLVNSSLFASFSIPSAMIAGQQYSITVTFTNNGSSTWALSTNHNLGTLNDDTTFNLPFNGNRAHLAASVTPGNNAVFTFFVRAPATPGNYTMQFRMVQDTVEWFGAISPVAFVAVAAAESPNLIPVTIGVKL
jgi:hypothetical protein